MSVVVQKYGGSSVADIDKLRAVADQVVRAKEHGNDVVVVVSAMGKTTDNLLSLAQKAADGAAEPPKRELDMLVSTGERVSMALLSIAIQARGHDAVSFTGSQSGIITNDRHFDARIIEVRPHRIEDELARGRIVIVAGYQGMSYKREITTLGRGGSDTTAVALAAALGAERCEIYSDVDGVYSADPRIVPDAVHLPTLDYETMQEMAESGAKVLNAQAVEWARKNRVAILARRTGDVLRESPPRETIVSTDGGARQLSVVVQRATALLSASGNAAGRLFTALARAAVPLGDLSAASDGIVAWAPLTNVPNFGEAERILESAEIPGLVVEHGFGLLSLVGVEIAARPELLGKALGLLAEAPRACFVHPLRLSVALPVDQLEDAAKSWHSAFVGSAEGTLLSA
ncbi:MAG: aspartate kinase [Myxococcales bacterium]|nr:aspartate kinase [Myxococcales bacterium]MCB9577853.1 aspartate kinase [Polyangiaceae bacterium]